MTTLAPCHAHRDVPAGFACTDGCRQPICGACTARSVANQYHCCLCGGAARQLTVARTARSRGFWLVETAVYPLKHGLVALAIAVALVAATTYGLAALAPDTHDFDGLARLVRGGVLFVYALVVVDATARGGQREAGGAIRVARALAASLVVVGPGVLYLYLLGAPTRATDPAVLLFGALAIAYLPLALAVAATDISFGTATSPRQVFALAWPLGRRYFGTLALVVVLGALTIQLSLVQPIAGVLALTVVAHVIGLVPHIHGEALQWGAAEMFRDPALPGQRATGQRKLAEVLTTEALTRGARSVEAAAPPEERSDAKKIAELLERDNGPRALKLYEARPAWSPTTFDDKQLLALGRAAARGKKLELAVALFDEGIARAGRGVPQLMIAKGQALAEAGRGAEARACYRGVVEAYPGSDPAKIAQRAIEAL